MNPEVRAHPMGKRAASKHRARGPKAPRNAKPAPPRQAAPRPAASPSVAPALPREPAPAAPSAAPKEPPAPAPAAPAPRALRAPRRALLALAAVGSVVSFLASVQRNAPRAAASPAPLARPRAPEPAAPSPPPSPAVAAPSVSPSPRAPRYLRGQLHAHTSLSSDSATPPSAVVHWYASRGYDFLVLTDHNWVTRTQAAAGSMLVLPGAELTQNVYRCDRGAPDHAACLIHLNALLVREDAAGRVELPRPSSLERLALYDSTLRAARALGPLVQLNHPNFEHTADARTVTVMAERGLRLLEIMNHVVDAPGGAASDARSPEALWDAALTAGHTLWGVATDDAHDYPGEPLASGHRPVRHGRDTHTAGHAWVMVDAAERTADSLREALWEGRFYSSTGVRLERAGVEDGALLVRVAPDAQGAHRVDFLGRNGALLARSEGPEARYPLAQLEVGAYVRAVVYGPDGARAWVQPARR